MHNPIKIHQLSFTLPHKICFENFSYTIYSGEKIAIIGNNGEGKSSLLKMLSKLMAPSEGFIDIPTELITAYIPQIISQYNDLSGAQRFNQALSLEIAKGPNLILLDEPTNHLDEDNRSTLLKMLKYNSVTQIIVSHDIELLDSYIETLWHIHDGQITIFNGSYSNYRKLLKQEQDKLTLQLNELKQSKKKQHQALMKEQQRAKNSRAQGEKHIKEHKWPTITSSTKARRAETTAGKNTAYLNKVKDNINCQLKQLWVPEEITYKFELTPQVTSKNIVTLNNVSCGYIQARAIINNISLKLNCTDRVAIVGRNGSGKSTLIKAILKFENIWRSGEWKVPNLYDIAYIDQHYSNLSLDRTLIDVISDQSANLPYAEVRSFLNQFLFRKNEEINNLIANLSGGEKARLSLAIVALQRPKLLILDEITNNIDLISKEYITQLLKNYPGAMLLISHDKHFLNEIGVADYLAL